MSLKNTIMKTFENFYNDWMGDIIAEAKRNAKRINKELREEERKQAVAKTKEYMSMACNPQVSLRTNINIRLAPEA
jgi:hypothetical protein